MAMKPGYRQTEVGVLPKDWDVALMDSVAKRGSGHTPDKQHPEYWGGSIKWISLKDSDRLDTLYIAETAATITPAGIANSSAVMHRAGTVVLSRDAGVGKSSIMKDEMAVSQHFIAWLCGPRLDNHFLYYWLQAKKSEFERIAFGNTIKTIGLSYFKKLKLPLPLLHEQQMIAAALITVDTLISELDQLITKKKALKRAAMRQLLTGKRRLPGFSEEWKVRPLGDVGFFSKGKGIKKDEVVQDGVPCIRYGEIYTVHNDFVRKFFSFIPREITKESQLIRKGDLLFAGSGETAEEIGKCVAFLGDEEVYAGGDIVIFTPKEQNSMYLGYLMNHPSVTCQKARMGQGDAVVHISASNLGQLELFLPRKEEQAAIAAVLSDMDAEIAALEQRRDKTRAIKQGMMQELLTGKTRLI
jgi:type I restriction enzyme S subunit